MIDYKNDYFYLSLIVIQANESVVIHLFEGDKDVK